MKARRGGQRGVQRIEAVDSEPVLGSDLPSMDDDSLSLEQLGKVYAEMLAGNTELIESHPENQASLGNESNSNSLDLKTLESEIAIEDAASALSSSQAKPNDSPSDDLAITPEGITEALLFVGLPSNKPLSCEQIAGTMRGVHADEIPDFIERLNKIYEANGRAMRIVEDKDGFTMRIAPELRRSSNAVQGKLRETRLPPAAVDCLALVAYNPGATREEIEKLWNRSASSMLNLLVRKDLLEIHRDDPDESPERTKKPKILDARYHPTERFLNLLGLSSLQDLPRVDSDL